ncbi:MAG: hypothetical protein GWN47_03310 [Woeseiaceae bacterium]|nr:hypothetical protein [Woeseiaceae bacterium]
MEKILKLDLENLEGARKTLVILGILLLAVSVVFLIGSFLGIVSMESLAIGQQSGLRTLAGGAVVGCLLAAIGYWDR